MEDSAWRLYRSAGTLLLASADVDDLAAQDMLDSLLLAELVAFRKHDPYAASSLWRKTWSQTMGRLHWAATASHGQEEVRTEPFTLASLLAHDTGTSTELDLAHLLASMETAHAKALEGFCTRWHGDSMRVRFRLALAQRPSTLQLSSVAFEHVTAQGDQWMSRTYAATERSPVAITRTRTMLALTSDYAQERDKVIESLGNMRARDIQRIQAIIKP